MLHLQIIENKYKKINLVKLKDIKKHFQKIF